MFTKSKSIITFFISLIVSLQLNAMQAPRPSLSNSDFKAAGVLPYTRWKPKAQGGNAWFLFSQEAFGRDKNSYDGFSGKKDHQEGHPVVTASREFAEESLGILGNARTIKAHIDVSAGNTLHIIHRSSKKYVTYITKFQPAQLEKLARKFYKKLPTNPKSEKNSLRWVKWADLEKMVQQSTPGQNTYSVKAAKVNKRTGKVLKDAQGKHVTEYINIRPIVVAMLRPLFQNQSYTPGKDPKIRFYN